MSNKPTKTMELMQIVELATTRKGRESSSNNILRRINSLENYLPADTCIAQY